MQSFINLPQSQALPSEKTRTMFERLGQNILKNDRYRQRTTRSSGFPFQSDGNGEVS